MKKIFLPVLTAGILFSSCEKAASDCELIPAEIIRYDCDRVIFKLHTSQNIGDADWVDVQNGQHHSNVVSYYNTCAVSAITNGEMKTLYVKLKKVNEDLVDGNCIQCLAISQNPPQSKVDFTTVSAEPCEEILE